MTEVCPHKTSFVKFWGITVSAVVAIASGITLEANNYELGIPATWLATMGVLQAAIIIPAVAVHNPNH